MPEAIIPLPIRLQQGHFTFVRVMWVPSTMAWRVLKLRSVSTYVLNMQSRQQARCGPSAWGLGEGLTTTPHREEEQLVTKCYSGPRIWTDSLVQNRDQWRALVNTVMNLQIPQKTGNFLTSWVTVILWRTLLHGVSYLFKTSPIWNSVTLILGFIYKLYTWIWFFAVTFTREERAHNL
jgi:hypothetical protein